MPLEHHYERQQTPLRRLTSRERTILLVAVLVLAVGGLATVVLGASNGKIAPDHAGCVAVANASTMGGAMQRACGPAARRWCATPEANAGDTYSRTVQAACRRAGIG
jgi:hypothetical protein